MVYGVPFALSGVCPGFNKWIKNIFMSLSVTYDIRITQKIDYF